MIDVRALAASLGMVVSAASPAAADSSINFGFDLGFMIGHGSLAERLDVEQSIGVGGELEHRDFAASGGLVILRGDGDQRDGEVDAFGWNVMARWHFLASDAGRSFLGLGYSEVGLRNTAMPYGHRGRAFGPKVALGTDYLATLGPRTMGVGVAATYQYLTATFDDGERRHGGYAGIEVTFLMGHGRCHHVAGTTCTP